MNAPIELIDMVLMKKATMELEAICIKNDIDFSALCYFLIKYNGVVTGSCAMHCFYDADFNDIDIFIENHSTDLYKDLCNMCSSFRIPTVLDKCHYKIGIIDLSIKNEAVKRAVKLYVDIECTSIMFDGTTWYMPWINNIFGHLESRCTKIIYFSTNNFTKLYMNTTLDNINSYISNMVLPAICDSADLLMSKYYNVFRKYFSEVTIKMDYIEGVVKIIYITDTDTDVSDYQKMRMPNRCVIYVPYSYIYTVQEAINNFVNEIIVTNMCNVYNKILEINGSNDFIDCADVDLGDAINVKLDKIFNMYKLQYRILKYIARGMIFANLHNFMEKIEK